MVYCPFMTENHTDIFRRLHEDHQILDEPQFTVNDARDVVGASPKAIEHMLDPAKGRIRLSGRTANPGKGKRRMLTGEDILKLAAAHAMGEIGFPHRWSVVLTDQIATRASARIIGIAQGDRMAFATYPGKNGDWAFTPLFQDQKEEPRLPLAVQILDVDRLIDETLAKLVAIVDDQPIPDFSVPDIKVEDPYSPETDFFGRWTKDSAGNQCLVGLTFEETTEYSDHTEKRSTRGDDEFPWDSIEEMHAEKARYLELHDKHELARQRRLAEEMVQRATGTTNDATDNVGGASG